MEEKWTTIIKPKTEWFDINFKEIVQYRDLIGLFVKRNFAVQYKQTILGPLWFIINPILTTLVFTLIFGRVAGLSTDGVPQFAFYLCSNAIWQYFATCLTQTSSTFTGNAAIFGKVYFPRITMPISTVIFSLINFAVVFVMALLVIGYYVITGEKVQPNVGMILVPILVLQTALLGLGFGIIISSLTTKYRDLVILVSFGVQLWMYATPVVYTITDMSDRVRSILLLNPMAPIIINFRYVMLGCGYLETFYWGISAITTLVVLGIGIVLFNRIEKTFMDTV